jgi:hypothetical protein
MNKMKNTSLCSPYLQRPLRSLDQALRDQAHIAPKEEAPRFKQRGPATLLYFPKCKLAK